jgi:mannonate dehydratase
VVPEAEKANVRLALHPNDPPVPLSRGSEQLMATFEHWKEYLSPVESPFNGMTFDGGQVDMFRVMRELVRQKYPRAIYPEHPRALDVDREGGSVRNQYPGGGGFAGEIYNVGYARAMLQAALTV